MLKASAGDKYNTMKTINRDKLIQEELLREHIRGRIQKRATSQLISEEKIRKVIRSIISEVATGTEEPSSHTGINVLASLLEKIVPILEADYKMLTTSGEQRESFRNHIAQAIKNSLRPIEVTNDIEGEALPESFVFTIDRETLLQEKVIIDLDPEDDEEDSDAESVSGEFIDIDDGDDDDFVQINNQNETGRNFASVTFKKIETQIVDAYDMLADEEDQDMFYEYLLTNILLYFDKFEDELMPALPDSTTAEYEEERNAEEQEIEEPSEPEEEDLGLDDL